MQRLEAIKLNCTLGYVFITILTNSRAFVVFLHDMWLNAPQVWPTLCARFSGDHVSSGEITEACSG